MNNIDLAHETSTSYLEWGVIAILVIGATFYLWRKFFSKKRSGCGGCASSKAGTGCSQHQ